MESIKPDYVGNKDGRSVESITGDLVSARSRSPEKARSDYLRWEDYFMSLAALSARRSKDPNTQVGAAIVTRDHKIVGLGYNGMPIGCHDDIMPWGKVGDDLSKTKYGFVCHAEMNAIMNKNTHDISGSTLYTTHFPCNECAKLVVQAQIKQDPIYVASSFLLDTAGVRYRQFQGERTELVINLNY
ncbi:deoxycytidylate deaminase-like isoform X2 [Varroa jacobsoni]|uniref:Probable deoxycytidylate deaminase n=1 Tax=Varroa destructor TaxID=109461 RepID=A0A7M7MBK1_VARDE|nr:deoxycytidylate deaminase-like isoform X2 [Varroa destructor]XP_022692144.1 deoxycytidylate deaminase-like isoform X2 [Varroa jacobsoni]